MRTFEVCPSPISTPAYVDNNTSGLCPRRRATSPIGTPAASQVVVKRNVTIDARLGVTLTLVLVAPCIQVHR
jgi:hypothetical protein